MANNSVTAPRRTCTARPAHAIMWRLRIVEIEGCGLALIIQYGCVDTRSERITPQLLNKELSANFTNQKPSNYHADKVLLSLYLTA